MRLRTVALLAPLLMALFVGGFSSATAVEPPAANGESTTVTGTLRNSAEDNAPVPGVTIRVTDGNGKEHVTESGEDGKFEIDVPAAGKTTIELEEDTLPEGVKVRDNIQNPLVVSLTGGRPTLPVNFSIGPDTRETTGLYDEASQAVYNGVLFGVILALGALGLSMIYGTTGLTNFAHGELITLGAILTFTLNVTLQLNIWAAMTGAVLLCALFGYLQDTVFWRRLRKRGTGLMAMMIVTIGMQFFLRYLYQYFTGGQTLKYDQYGSAPGHDMGFLPVRFTYVEVSTLGLSLVAIVVITLALQRSRIGRATRAIADNPSLAASTGINVNRIITLVWTVGTALAGACGVFFGLTQAVKFDLGAQLLLIMFAAITLGGLGSVWGAIIGSVIVGVFIELATLVLPSELKIATALFVLIVILLVRPQGLLGRRQRVG